MKYIEHIDGNIENNEIRNLRIRTSRHFPGRHSGPAVTPPPPDDPGPDELTRLVDEGIWQPVSNRFLGYGFFMFSLGFAAAKALARAMA